MHNHRETHETFTREGRVWLRGALDDACLGRLRQLSMLEARPGARISMTDPLQRVAFNRIQAFTGPGEAAFAQQNAFARSGEFN